MGDLRRGLAPFAASPAMRLCSTSPVDLQGIGGAAMFASTLALIAQEFDGRERATAIGAWNARLRLDMS